jgi:hypothetical protein
VKIRGLLIILAGAAHQERAGSRVRLPLRGCVIPWPPLVLGSTLLSSKAQHTGAATDAAELPLGLPSWRGVPERSRPAWRWR